MVFLAYFGVCGVFRSVARSWVVNHYDMINLHALCLTTGDWIPSDRSDRIPSLDGRNRVIVIAELSLRFESLALEVISAPHSQKLVLTDPAFVVPRFESRNWLSFVYFNIRSTWNCRMACES